MHGDIIRKDAAKREVYGWAYVAIDEDGEVVVDKSGEFIDQPEVLESAAYRFVHSSRKGGFMHQRVSKSDGVPFHASDMIESFVITKEKREAMGIPPGLIPELDWWVGFKIHDEDTWKIVEKTDTMFFSIHGRGRKEEVN